MGKLVPQAHATFQQMLEAGIKPECVQLLQEHFEIGTLEEHTRQESTDGTVKFLFRLWGRKSDRDGADEA